MDDRYDLTDLGRAYLEGLQEGKMNKVVCKKEHDFMPIFTDKVDGKAIIIIMCKKCGESKEINEYVGDNHPKT